MASFNEQWIEIFAAGSHTDSEGRTHNVTQDYIENAARNFDVSVHQAPIVVGHPADNLPAYGWVSKLRVSGDRLEAQFSDVDPLFEQLVSEGKFKKRSASFYVDPATAPNNRAPYLRHVGFLGAQPPAVKGLRDISFAEGKAVTFDFSEGDNMAIDEKTEQSLVTKIIDGLKSFLPKKDDDQSRSAASFSEGDVKTLVQDAVTAATASFNEKLTRLETENKTLRESVDSQGAKTTHTEIVAFVEKLGLEKCPPAFRQTGLIEFMEALTTIPSERKVTVVEFSEKEGEKIEVKTETPALEWFKNFMESLPKFVSFGEKYGAINQSGDASATVVTPERTKELREKAGLPAK